MEYYKFQIGDLVSLSKKVLVENISISKHVAHIQRKANGAFVVIDVNKNKYRCALCWFNEKTNHQHIAIDDNVVYFRVDRIFTFEENSLIFKEILDFKNLPTSAIDKILRARKKKLEKIKKKRKQIKELKAKRKPIAKEVPKNIQWALAHPYQGGSCSGK